MKRSVAALVSLALVGGGVAAGALPAAAAPPTAPWSASAGGSAAAIALSVEGFPLASGSVVNALSTTDSQATPRSSSVASNGAADVVGLDFTPDENRIDAPPDGGPTTSPLVGIETGLIDATGLESTNEAHWAGDGQCTVEDRLARTSASADSISVAEGLAEITGIETTGTTELVGTGGPAYDVVSTATGSVDGQVLLLGGLVTIDVAGTTTLTARSDGVGPGTIQYVPATVRVTDTTTGTVTTLVAGAEPTTVDTAAGGVVVSQDAPPTDADGGTAARATTALARISVSSILEVTATFDLLPLSVSAAAPAGGLDCTLPAPSISVPTTGATVRDATPTISGLGLPGATVTVLVDGDPVGTALVVEDGTFTLPATTPLAAGERVATATQVLGELSSAASAPVPFIVDLTPPAPPVIQVPADGATTGPRPPISGTAPATSTVELFVDGTSIGETTATPQGTFTFTPTADIDGGDHVITATATDAVGTSLPSNAVDITVDGTPPAPPVIISPLNGTVTNDDTVPVSGTAEVGTTVRVTASPTGGTSEVASGPVPVGADGGWALELPALADGSYTLTARATDAVGNESGPSNSRVVIVDTVAPAAPVITSPLTGTTTTNPRPAIEGTADPASTSVSVIVDGVIIGTAPVAIVGGAGSWTFTPTSDLAEGARTISATARDAAGNISQPSNAVVIIIDAVPPAPPVITEPANGSSTNNRTPTAVAVTEPGATVEFVLDEVPVGTAIADGTGLASLQLPTLDDGAYTLLATASTESGESEPSEPVTFAVDTVAPPAPVITSPAAGSTTGPQPPISGTAQPATTVQVIVDGRVVGTGTAGADGRFSIIPNAPLGAGARTVTAVATDAAGNASPRSAAVTFTVSGRLAATGTDGPLGTPALALILLALGAVLVVMRRRQHAAG